MPKSVPLMHKRTNPVTNGRLRRARRAIESARGEAGPRREDGIGYLIRAIRNGITTPLTAEYVSEVPRITGTPHLKAAWMAIVSQSH